MAGKSAIGWTDYTLNFMKGCKHKGDDCENCYAEDWAGMPSLSGVGRPYENLVQITPRGAKWNGKLAIDESLIDKPLHLLRNRMIFVNSMSDFWLESAPHAVLLRAWTAFQLADWHIIQILTKRAQEAAEWFLNYFENGKLPENIWVGISAGRQRYFDERFAQIRKAQLSHMWLSLEPQLERICFWPAVAPTCTTCKAVMPENLPENGQSAFVYDPAPADGLTGWHHHCDAEWLSPCAQMVQWVVAGAESCRNNPARARAVHPDVFEYDRVQCEKARVPFFYKQNGEWAAAADFPKVTNKPTCEVYMTDETGAQVERRKLKMVLVGKARSGNKLQGETYEQYPPVFAAVLQRPARKGLKL